MPNNFPHDSDVLVKGLSFANYGFSWILFPIMSSVSKLQLDEKFKVSSKMKTEKRLYLICPPIEFSHLGTPVPNGFKSQEKIICTRFSSQILSYCDQITDKLPVGLLA